MTKLLTVSDTALFFNISVISLRRLIKKKEIPYRRIGRKYFFTEEDIQTFLLQTAVPIGGKGEDPR